MPEAFPSMWQTVEHLWRWTNLLVRLDLVALALMFGQVFVLLSLAFCRSYPGRPATTNDKLGPSLGLRPREVVWDLQNFARDVRWIASAAPFLGLVGACLQILSAFRGFDMSRQDALVMEASRIAASLLSTGAGILVAIPAIGAYNYICSRIGWFQCKICDVSQKPSRERRLPLASPFSALPTFGLLAAAALAICVAAFMVLPRFHASKGLHVRLLEIGRLEPEKPSLTQPILIRLLATKTGSPIIYVDSRQTRAEDLSLGLQTYVGRDHRVANVAADSNLSWAEVANAIDTVKGLGGDVVLLTAPPNSYFGRKW